MAAHAAFEKKCLHLLHDGPSDASLPWQSLGYSELFMEKLLGHYSPEMILRNILDADAVQKPSLQAAYHALHVPETSQVFTDLAIAIGQPHVLHNQVIAFADSPMCAGRLSRDYAHEATLDAFVRLRQGRSGRIHDFAHPGYLFFADLTMEAAILSGSSPDAILPSLSVTEIQAAAGALRDQGLRILSDEMIERRLSKNDFPYFYLGACSDEELRPTFDLLSRFHGAYPAQLMMYRGQTSSVTKSLFLKAQQVADRFSEPSPLSALRRFIASKDELYKVSTRWVVEAMKREGLWNDLDTLTKRESKYLLEEGLLSVDEFDRLPKTAKLHGELRFATDLGL